MAVTVETERRPERVPARHVISSMPFTALARGVDPPVPDEVPPAADDLHYRDFLTVALVVPEDAWLPRQLDLHPLARRGGRVASRTSGRGRRTW